VIRIGCVLTLFSFLFSCCYGLRVAARYGRSGWLGLALGIVAWVAAISAYAAWLSVSDRLERHKHPARVKNPWWMVPMVWIVFAATIVGAVLLHARITR
jgi:uncharacterized membrane protein YidH (DUF202 family)